MEDKMEKYKILLEGLKWRRDSLTIWFRRDADELKLLDEHIDKCLDCISTNKESESFYTTINFLYFGGEIDSD